MTAATLTSKGQLTLPKDVRTALGVYQSSKSAEFADALIAQTAALAGASETVSFDRGAALDAGMRLLH